MVYRYKIRVSMQLESIVLLMIVCAVIILAISTPNSSPVGILSKVLGGILSSFFLLIILHDFKVLAHIKIDETSISAKRFLLPPRVIPYTEVQRILINRAENSIEGSQLALVVFGAGKKIRTVISDLQDVRGFVRLLEEKVHQHQLKYVKQDVDGQFVDDLLIH